MYLATKEDNHRKPQLGAWELFLKNNGLSAEEVTPADCIYVGDAAGRPKTNTRKKDFSDFDYKFALNAGFAF